MRELAPQESVPGTFETWRPGRKMSVNRGRPEVAGHRQNGANDPKRSYTHCVFDGRKL
jgi:hypothetical protein